MKNKVLIISILGLALFNIENSALSYPYTANPGDIFKLSYQDFQGWGQAYQPTILLCSFEAKGVPATLTVIFNGSNFNVGATTAMNVSANSVLSQVSSSENSISGNVKFTNLSSPMDLTFSNKNALTTTQFQSISITFYNTSYYQITLTSCYPVAN